MEKPHISNSQLDTFETCGEAWRRRYIEGEKIPPGFALLIGGGTHRGVEANFKQKIESHIDLPARDIIDAAVAGFDSELSGGYSVTEEEQSEGVKNVIGKARDQVASLAEVHAEQQAPDYQPIAVEKKILIPFPNASHDILGFVDLVDDAERVTDFKTAGKRKPQADADNSLQLTIYAAAYQIETGRPPAEVRLDTLVKTKKPARQLLVSSRGPADFQALINRVNAMLHAINAGVFPPAPVGSWKCSERFCGYYRTCPYINSTRKAVAEANEQ